jgi:hypothetical protein
MVESTDINRCVGANSAGQWNACIFQGVVDILQYQSLLRIQCQELVLCNVEEGAIEVGGVF